MKPQNSLVYLKHNLELLGLPPFDILGNRLFLHDISELENSQINWHAIENGALAVIMQPDLRVLKKIGISADFHDVSHADLQGVSHDKKLYTLRTLYPYFTYIGDCCEVIVKDENGHAVWLAVKVRLGYILIVGSSIEFDILRFRQGDPQCVDVKRGGDLWGIKGERPNYLFNRQIAGLHKHSRQADYWAHLLVEYICNLLKVEPRPVLPNGAIGAVIITGDDDQAFLDKYREQQLLLDGVPTTYFLHPKTKHTKKTLKLMSKGRRIDFGIHPDALENPTNYNNILKEQCAWYKSLMSNMPMSLRNHGYLNDGYWGHLNGWKKEGIAISSNIPGLDGTVLNGSLLPSKLFIQSELVDHWSILTAVGDGVRYIFNKSDADSAAYIYELRDSILSDGIPGVIVINLHPQNISDTRLMHIAAKDLINSGFIAWTMLDCLNWFEKSEISKPQNLLKKLIAYIRE